MRLKLVPFFLTVILLSSIAFPAQTGRIAVSFDESFLEAMLEAAFRDGGKIEFGENRTPRPLNQKTQTSMNAFAPTSECTEGVRLIREAKGRRTAVYLRDGGMTAQIAFEGSYRPLVGCIDYSGVADARIELSFDRNLQAMVGRVKVVNVNLNLTGGIGGSLIAKYVQTSIDEKVNPLQIVGLDRISFGIPVQKSSNISLRASDMSYQIGNGNITVFVNYEFLRM